MATQSEIVIWDDSQQIALPTGLSLPSDITPFARQLTAKERQQVISAFKSESYELATTFVWARAIASLKRELGSLGITFVAELLGRTDISEDDNVLDAISEKEAIRLAEELGIVSHTEAMRLRHTQELVSHFSQREPQDDPEPMEATDAASVLFSCVKSVLAKPSIQVARGFAKFRKELESESFIADDPRCDSLVSSPYFFRRLAITVLLSGIRSHSGAKLEHCLSNLNLLVPLVWTRLRETERWQIGTAYSQVYADGLQTQTAGLKQALLKVHGFDYVPENLRSQTFVKAAEALIAAHEGMNNFYNEQGPVENLEKLGSVIPAPAIGPCVTALLCTRLGNSYGAAWSAKPIADRMLRKQAPERWKYYLDKILPGELRILEKLTSEKPQKQWITLVQEIIGPDTGASDRLVRTMLEGAAENNAKKIGTAAEKLIAAYYKK